MFKHPITSENIKDGKYTLGTKDGLRPLWVVEFRNSQMIKYYDGKNELWDAITRFIIYSGDWVTISGGDTGGKYLLISEENL